MIEIVEESEIIKIKDKEYLIFDITTKMVRTFITTPESVSAEDIILNASNITKEVLENIQGSTVKKIASEILKLSGFLEDEESLTDAKDLKKN